ncbi:MAG: autotransporter domain-containing protein [Parvibaculaceae bacterium]
MAKNLSLRTKLLSTSALAVAGTFWLGASPALAVPAGSCVTAGTSTITITCTGNVPYQVSAPDDNTTVTLNANANVHESGAVAITLNGNNNALVMGADSQATSSASSGAVYAFGDASNVTLNGSASINLNNYNMRNDAFALNVEAIGGSSNIVLNGGSSINFAGGSYDNGYDGHRASGIGAFGEKIKITLNGESAINVTGTGEETDVGQTIQNDYVGVFMTSTAEQIANSNTITLNGGSSINVTRAGVDTYGSITGIYANTVSDGKYAANITLNNSSVHVTGAGISNGEKYAGILSKGADARVTLNGSQIVVTGASVNDNNKYVGLTIVQQNNTSAASGGLTLANESSVTITANGTGQHATLIGAFVDNKYLSTKVGAVTMDGGSTITLNANGDTNGAVGIASKGYAPVITMSNGSAVTINAHGGSTNAKYFGAEILGVDQNNGGGHGRITLNAGSSFNLTGAGASDSKYAGILTIGYTDANKYAPAVTLNDSFIRITDTAGAGGNKYVGVLSFGGGPITLNGTSAINLGSENGSDASKYVGIMALTSTGMVAPQIVLNGTSSVNITGSGHSASAKYFGVGVAGEGAVVTLNGHSSVNIEVKDHSKYVVGIFEMGTDNYITLNDNTSVRVFGGSYAEGAGIYMGGDGGALTLNGHSHVDATYSANVSGVDVGGNDTSVTLNDYAAIYAGGDSAGILDRGDNNTIVIGQHAYVAGDHGIVMAGNFGTLIVRGSVAGYSGTAIQTSSGSNSSVTLDSAFVNGFVLGGGTDTLTLAGTGNMLSGAQGFGLLNMDGVHWNLLAGTINSADEVSITSGRLAVNGTLTTDVVTVHSGGSLGGTGTITGDIVVEAGGAVAPGNSPGTLNVVGPVTFNAGSIFEVEIGATAADLLNATGAVTITPGAIVNPTFFPGADGFVGDIVTGASVTGTFTPGSGAALVYTPGVVSLTAASSSSMNGGMSAGVAQGFTFLDTVLGEAQKSASVGKTLWGTALWSRSTRTAASTSSRGFDQHSNGGAFGGDVMSSGDFTLGLAAGYLDGDAITSGGGSRTSIEGYHAAVYSTYTFGGTYFTSALTGAYQDQDAKRNVFAGGVLVGAQGSPEAWLGGVGLGIGHEFPLNNAFTITPRANLAYQHMARDGYTETGGGTGALALDAINTDTVRGRVGAELAFKVADKNAMWSVRPSVNAALAKEWRAGDATTTGTFRTTGAAFNNTLDSRDQTYLALGAGVDMTVGYGVTAFVNYDGGVGGDAERSGGWRLGARMEW